MLQPRCFGEVWGLGGWETHKHVWKGVWWKHFCVTNACSLSSEFLLFFTSRSCIWVPVLTFVFCPPPRSGAQRRSDRWNRFFFFSPYSPTNEKGAYCPKSGTKAKGTGILFSKTCKKKKKVCQEEASVSHVHTKGISKKKKRSVSVCSWQGKRWVERRIFVTARRKRCLLVSPLKSKSKT